MKTLYVNAKQEVTISCDHCGRTHNTKVPLHIRGNTPVQAKCLCGQTTDVTFEFRQTYRKNIFLQGLLRRHATDVVGQTAQLRNLSKSGIKFTTSWWRNICPHDILSITFILDNPQRSKIDKRVMIKYIDKQVIGAQFCPEDQWSYQKEIGFYLMGQCVPRETDANRVAPAASVAYGYV
jgi:hypothetical protein